MVRLSGHQVIMSGFGLGFSDQGQGSVTRVRVQ